MQPLKSGQIPAPWFAICPVLLHYTGFCLEWSLRWFSVVCVQVDVLESQFSQLLQQINSTRDFESIRLAHDHFLSNLLAQSFILLKPVCPLLTRYTLLLKPGLVFPD